MENQKLSKLKQSAKDYYDKQKKILDAEYDFIDKVIQSRGKNSVNNSNVENVNNILVSSLSEFLSS